tara:strand:- start:269 stop:844 length:576 start_codon:yes stop_codon:yes gene_type:complete
MLINESKNNENRENNDFDDDMNINIDIKKLEDELLNIDNNKLNIQIFFISNGIIEKIVNKKQYYKDKLTLELLKNILNKVKNSYCNNNYKISYLLNFNIYTTMETLNFLNDYNNNSKSDLDNNIFELDILSNNRINKFIKEDKRKDNLDNFTDANSLIIILEKNFYYRKDNKNNKNNKNRTQKYKNKLKLN